MPVWLPATVDCLLPRARRVLVVAMTVLLVADAITSLTVHAVPRAAHRPTPVRPQKTPLGSARTLPPPVSRPVSAAGLRVAHVGAARFLRSYLRFAYGSG